MSFSCGLATLLLGLAWCCCGSRGRSICRVGGSIWMLHKPIKNLERHQHSNGNECVEKNSFYNIIIGITVSNGNYSCRHFGLRLKPVPARKRKKWRSHFGLWLKPSSSMKWSYADIVIMRCLLDLRDSGWIHRWIRTRERWKKVASERRFIHVLSTWFKLRCSPRMKTRNENK